MAAQQADQWTVVKSDPLPKTPDQWTVVKSEKATQPSADAKPTALQQAWDVVNKPLVPQIAEIGHAAADAMESNATAGNAALSSLPLPSRAMAYMAGFAARPTTNKTELEAQARAFMADSLRRSSDVVSSFTSPASVLMWAAGAGEASAAKAGLTNVARFLGALRKGGGAVFSATGVQQAKEGFEQGDFGKLAIGVGTAAGGAAGAIEPLPARAKAAVTARTPPRGVELENTGEAPASPVAAPAAAEKASGWKVVKSEPLPFSDNPTAPENLQKTTAQAGQQTFADRLDQPRVASGAEPESIDVPTPEKIREAATPAPTSARLLPLPTLPPDLRGAKPRYNYGQKAFDLTFESDVDRAAYIAAQAKPSARDADYVRFAQAHLGGSEADVRAYGQDVRARIKQLAATSEPGTLTIPSATPPKPAVNVQPLPEVPPKPERTAFEDLRDELVAQGVLPASERSGKPAETLPAPKDIPHLDNPQDARPGQYYTVDPQAIKTDPARFQFKGGGDATGVTPEGRLPGPWNEKRAGVGDVWQDPDTGDLYSVNMHHRLDLAKREGAPRMAVRVLESMSAPQALIEGALTNIGEGHGSPVDVARVMRTNQFTDEQLRSAGINTRTGLAKQGRGLAQLSEPLFVKAATGDLDPALGAAIGEAGLSPEGQANVVTLIDRQAAKGREMTPGQVKALIEDAKSASDVEVNRDQLGLFGDAQMENTAVERATLRDWLPTELAKDKRVFGSLAKMDAAKVAEAGNTIDKARSAARAEQAAVTEAIVRKLAQVKGPVSSALNDAAMRIAKGESERVVRAELLNTVKGAVAEELRGHSTDASGPGPSAPVDAEPPAGTGSEPPDAAPSGPGLFGNDEGSIDPNLLAPAPLQRMAIDAVNAAKAQKAEWKTRLSPKTASPEGARTADMLREALGRIVNSEDLRKVQGKPDEAFYAKQPDAVNEKQIGDYERTGKFPNAPAGFTERFSQRMKIAHEFLEKAFGDDKVGFIENYVRHAFDFKTEADANHAVDALLPKAGRGSLSADGSVVKRRMFRMPVDEALQTMRDAGIDVKLKTSNPELLGQLAVNNAYRAYRFKQLGDSLKDEGLITFVRPGEKVPYGKVPLSDRRFNVFFKGDGGLVKAGTYYADQPVANLLDRTISKGFGHIALFRGLRATNNLMNQWNLGFSAFHATETALNSTLSDLALSIKQLQGGNLSGAAASAGRAATFIGSPIGQYVRGRAFTKALEGPIRIDGDGIVAGYRRAVRAVSDRLIKADPDALAVLQDRVSPAGARLALESRYQTDFIQSFQRSWANSEYGKAIFNAVGSIPTVLSKPLMEVAIPRIKVGAFLDLAAEIKAQMPNASPAEIQHAYGLAWDSIDNRLGQLTYDNLFWNRKAVDLGQMAFRSLGWNHGTELELAGGLKDLGKLAKTGQVSDRLAYTMALPLYMALVGTVYQVAHGAGVPETLKDLFYPKNGLKDPSGNPDRVAIKSYMSDAINFARDPKTTLEHKVSPLVGLGAALASNQNYFGDLIRNPEDPIAKQLEQTGKFVLESFVPLSLSQAKGLSNEGQPIEQSVERGLAVQKAPAWAIKSDLQQKAEELMHAKLGDRHRTPEQVNIDTLKTAARDELRLRGVTPVLRQKIQDLVKAGAFQTSDQALSFLSKSLTQTPLQRTLGSLSIAERIKLLQSKGGKQ